MVAAARPSQRIALWLVGIAGLLADMRRRPVRADALDTIREQMLRTLESFPAHGRSTQGMRVAHRIRACREATALWYLRSELMQVLCAHCGEREARRLLLPITESFDGLLPSGLHSNRAPLR